jgi:hypothetical protein
MQSSYEFRPGLLASAGAAWRLLDADGARPFVVATGQLAFIATKTDPTSANGASVGYEALDLRMGASAGWPLWNTLTPYAGMRVFGGPVFWQYQGASVTGTDVHHFQVVGGALLRFLKRFDIFVEASPLGEQMLSLGAGCTL